MALRRRPCAACLAKAARVPAKYRCPRCDVASCSLACVNLHKRQTRCNGIRDRAAPVPKADYTDTHLMSDYVLLEDAARVVDAASRPPPPLSAANPPPGISKGRMSLLAREAVKRNIRLRFMPRGMSRHARNSSFVRSLPEPDPPAPRRDRRERAMYWHLDLYFASCSRRAPGTKLVKVDACEEEQLISAILEGATGALKKGRKRRKSSTITCTSKANDGYAKYLHAHPDDLVVFIRNEHVVSAAANLGSPTLSARATTSTTTATTATTRKDEFDINRYVPLDNNHTLRQVLDGRSVIEFPVLHVAFKNSKEAKELAAATSGIFEKPDDSSDSDSSSYHSELDDAKEQAAEPPVADLHAGDTAKAENSKLGISSQLEKSEALPATQVPEEKDEDDCEEEDGDDEPLPKRRKVDVSPKVTSSKEQQPATDDGDGHAAKDIDIPSSIADPKGHFSGASVVLSASLKPNEDITGPAAVKDEGIEGNKTLPVTVDKAIKNESAALGRATEEGLDNENRKHSSIETAARRGGGMSLDHPFMKESVKAILETRIPRKPKVDSSKGAAVPSGSGKRSTKLTATG